MCVRRGDLVVHVNAIGMLPQVFEVLDARTLAVSPLATLAEAADQVVQTASRRHPALRIRSIRDVVYHLRHGMEGKDVKLLQQLQAAFNVLRHMPHREIVARCAHISERIKSCDGEAGKAEELGASDVVVSEAAVHRLERRGCEGATLRAQSNGSKANLNAACVDSGVASDRAAVQMVGAVRGPRVGLAGARGPDFGSGLAAPEVCGAMLGLGLARLAARTARLGPGLEARGDCEAER